MTQDEIKFKCIELAQEELRIPQGAAQSPSQIQQFPSRDRFTEDAILERSQKHLNVFLKLTFTI